MMLICRLCLSKQEGPLENIISSSLKCSDLTLIDCLYWVFGVEINITDPFSKSICTQCICVIRYVGNFRNIFQKSQTILQEGVFKNHQREGSISPTIATSSETNVPTSVKSINIAKVVVSQPSINLLRLEQSDICREYTRINETLYKKIQNVDKGIDKRYFTRIWSTPKPPIGKLKCAKTQTDLADGNYVRIPIDTCTAVFSPSVFIPRLEDTDFRKEFKKISDTTYKRISRKSNLDLIKYKARQLKFIKYYYSIQTSALQELIRGRRCDEEPLLKIDRENRVYVCDHCNEVFDTNRKLNLHYESKHRPVAEGETHKRGRKLRKMKRNRKWSRKKLKSMKSLNELTTKRLVSIRNNAYLPNLTSRLLLSGMTPTFFNLSKLPKFDQSRCKKILSKRELFPNLKFVQDSRDEEMKNTSQDQLLLPTRDNQQYVPELANVKEISHRIEFQEKVTCESQLVQKGDVSLEGDLGNDTPISEPNQDQRGQEKGDISLNDDLGNDTPISEPSQDQRAQQKRDISLNDDLGNDTPISEPNQDQQEGDISLNDDLGNDTPISELHQDQREQQRGVISLNDDLGNDTPISEPNQDQQEGDISLNDDLGNDTPISEPNQDQQEGDISLNDDLGNDTPISELHQDQREQQRGVISLNDDLGNDTPISEPNQDQQEGDISLNDDLGNDTPISELHQDQREQQKGDISLSDDLENDTPISEPSQDQSVESNNMVLT